MKTLIELLESLRPIDWSVLIIGILSYFFLCRTTIKEKGAGQSTLTWALWTLLDITQFIITYKAGGYTALLLFVFGIGGIIVTMILLILKVKSRWTIIDTIIVISLIICVGLYLTVENVTWVIILACIAQFIAGIPLIKETWREPNENYIWPNLVFLIMNTLGLLGAKSWQLKDVLLQEVMILYGLILLAILLFDYFMYTYNKRRGPLDF